MKLHLTINGGSLNGQTFELESGFLTVGRAETCSIRFDPLTERIASKQHAFIEAKADGYYVTDNQSTNGTLVNGNIITTAKLTNGDAIQFGKNGVTANVVIDGAVFTQVAIPQDQFRQVQIDQFDQIARSEPVSFQNSMANFGLGGSAVKTEPSKTGRYIGIAVTIFALILMLMVVLLIFSNNLTFEAATKAAIIAFVPATLYIFPLVWLDRYDPEPSWLLALAFAWGALVAIIVSYFVNTNIEKLVLKLTASPEYSLIAGAVISAPIFEEASKGIGVLVLLLMFRRYFDDILDGIVFAGVIALGFATVENVLYYGATIQEFGVNTDQFKAIFVVRGICSPWAHVTFTAMTGIGCGIARESHNRLVRIGLPVLGYCVAVALHMIWNGAALFGGFMVFAAGYLVVGVPFFAIFLIFAFYVMWRQNKILKEMLAIDIARGLISSELAGKVTSAFRSSGWLFAGLFAGKYRARSRYLRAVGKLGLSYWHIQRATVAHGQTGSFQQNPILREEVLKWRDQV